MPKATEITLKLSIKVQRKSKGNSQWPGTAKFTQSHSKINSLKVTRPAHTHTEIYEQTNRKCQCKLKEFGKLGGESAHLNESNSFRRENRFHTKQNEMEI